MKRVPNTDCLIFSLKYKLSAYVHADKYGVGTYTKPFVGPPTRGAYNLFSSDHNCFFASAQRDCFSFPGGGITYCLLMHTAYAAYYYHYLFHWQPRPFPLSYMCTVLLYMLCTECQMLLRKDVPWFIYIRESYPGINVLSMISHRHGLINYSSHQSKMSSSKKMRCKGTLPQVFICQRPPPFLRPHTPHTHCIRV